MFVQRKCFVAHSSRLEGLVIPLYSVISLEGLVQLRGLRVLCARSFISNESF